MSGAGTAGIPATARAARALEQRRAEIAEATVERELAIRPDYWARFGAHGRARCVEDTGFHVTFLVAALTLGLPSIFHDYVAWLVPMLEARGIERDDVIENFRALGTVLGETLADDEGAAVRALIDAEIAGLLGGAGGGGA